MGKICNGELLPAGSSFPLVLRDFTPHYEGLFSRTINLSGGAIQRPKRLRSCKIGYQAGDLPSSEVGRQITAADEVISNSTHLNGDKKVASSVPDWPKMDEFGRVATANSPLQILPIRQLS